MPTKKSRPGNRQKPSESKALVPAGREAPPERSIERSQILSPMFTTAQMNLVLNKTPEYAIKSRQGPGGVYRYIPHGYVTDMLNKIFGFDWDFDLVPMADGQMFALQVEELPVFVKGKQTGTELKRHVAVSGRITARVHGAGGKVVGELHKSGFGSQLWLPGAEFGDALKGATSDCLKVCAQRLGIGLDLYYSEDEAVARYEEKMAASDQNAQLERLMSQPPTTLPVLISRAKSEYGLGLADLEGYAKAKVAEMMNWDAGRIGDLWKVIVENGQVVDGEVKE